MAIISYGGLLVGSTQGSEPAIGEWIKTAIRPSEIFPSARLQWPGYLSGGPLFEQTAYPWDHVEIDRLYWPWGASRFAHAHVVVDDVTLAKIRLLAYANQRFKSLDFVMEDGWYNTPITTKLWIQAARPLSTAAPGGNALYLLSLVDDRYFWWETSLQYDVNPGTTTWANLYTSIGTALGVTITPDTINAAYGTPTGDYSAAYRQTPIVLDAVAWSVGQRVVRKLDGTVITLNPTTAIASQNAQVDKHAGRKRRGGVFDLDKNKSNDLSALVPATIKVVYSTTGSAAPASGYPSSTTLAALNLSQYPQPQISGQPWTKILHRYEIATYAGGANPTNKTTLDAITAQFATDWYLWQLASLDRWHVGIVQWVSDGLNDIEWRNTGGEVFTHVKRTVMNPQEDLIAPAPVVKGSECAVRDQTTCIAGREVRRLSYDCGQNWEIVEDLGVCSPLLPCRTFFEPEIRYSPGPCISGLDYVYAQTVQDFYDELGCLHRTYGPKILTATGKCCSVCGGSGTSGITGGTGGTCAGLPCPYCVSTTPCQWTGTITCPDFGSGAGGTNNCTACSPKTAITWSFTGSGFTGNFTPFNVTISLSWASQGGDTCYWYYFTGIGDIAAQVFVDSNGASTVVNLQLLAPDGVTWVEYELTISTANINCCIDRTLDIVSASELSGYPATAVVSPVCGDIVACTPDPSGTWTFTQLQAQTCAWSQYKSGVTGVVNLLYDPIGQQFELLLVLTSSDYVMVFVYLSPLGQTTFDCTRTYHLHLISSPQCVCSDTPVEVVLTPVAQAAACCTGLTGTGTTGTGSTGTGGGAVCGTLGAHLCAVVAGSSSLDGRYNFTWNAGIQEWIGVIGGCTFHISCPVNPADVTQYLLSNDTFGGSDSPQAGSTLSPVNIIYTRFGILGPCGDVPPSSPTITFSQGFC